MKSVTYRIESELDFQRIVSSLEESDISFTTKLYSDSSFPSLGQGKAFGDITVDIENELKLKSLIENLTKTQPIRIDQAAGLSGKRKSVSQIILIAYAIVVTAVCVRYWFLNHRMSEDKNNMFEWSLDGADLITKSKKSGVILHLSKDANFDQNFELVFSYSEKGVPLARWRDLNEDGFYEETMFYSIKGALTGVQFDRDNDGIVEEATILLEDQDTLKLLDPDEDGVFALERIIN